MKQDQKSVFKLNFISNQRGQAVVEYILLMVITLSLLFVAKKLFSSFNLYAESYIGGYTRCLMEFGELPSLGISDADLKKHTSKSDCNKSYESFTIAGGRPPVASNSRAGGNGGNGTNSNGKNNNANNSSNAGSSGSGSDGSDSDSFKAGGKKTTNARGRVQRSDGGYGTGDNSSDLAKSQSRVKIIETDEDKKSSGYGRTTAVNQFNNPNGRGSKYRAITGDELAKYEKVFKNSKRKPSATRINVTDDDSIGRGPAKSYIDPPSYKTSALPEENSSFFSFGNIFRWLLIIGMGVAIFIFFGSQLLNYSKSQE